MASEEAASVVPTAVNELETESQVLALLASKQPTLLLLYADTCKYCRLLMPAFDEAALSSAKNNRVSFARFNSFRHPTFSKVLNDTIRKFQRQWPMFVGIFGDGRVEAFPNSTDRSASKFLELASIIAHTDDEKPGFDL